MNTTSNPKAVLFRRAVAWSIDTFLILILISVVVITTAEHYDAPSGLSEEEICSQLSDASNNCLQVLDEVLVFDLGARSPIFWIPFFALLVNFVVLTGFMGFSIGKLLMGIRVVSREIRVVSRENRKLPGLTSAVGRTLPWIVVTAIPQIGLGLLLVEVALVISSSENRRLGDRIAGTVVISRSTSQEN